jgi:hypothetical protein
VAEKQGAEQKLKELQQSFDVLTESKSDLAKSYELKIKECEKTMQSALDIEVSKR